MAIKTDDITPSSNPLEDRIVTASASTDDNALERALRPKQLEEYVGQKKLADNLKYLFLPPNSVKRHLIMFCYLAPQV